MKSIAVLLCVVAAASDISFDDVIREEWKAFKLEYEKHFEDEAEDIRRMNFFVENKFNIEIHNQQFKRGLVSYRLKLNKYSDMLNDEFVKIMNGFNSTTEDAEGATDLNVSPITFLPPANMKLPQEVDWRKEGAVTGIKNQGLCGSCWAFSTTGSLEGQHYRKHGSLVSLSEQNLVDCTRPYGNHGCNGGLMNRAFKYIKNNGGIDTEKSYPYTGMEQTCRYDPKNSGATVAGFVNVPRGSEEKLKAAVATVGPVSVAVDASRRNFQHYSSGVYFGKTCSSSKLSHAMLVVGYGTDEVGGDYWLVKNSWGTSWGESGYIKMARNRHNHCGIASSASYPLV